MPRRHPRPGTPPPSTPGRLGSRPRSWRPSMPRRRPGGGLRVRPRPVGSARGRGAGARPCPGGATCGRGRPRPSVLAATQLAGRALAAARARLTRPRSGRHHPRTRGHRPGRPWPAQPGDSRPHGGPAARPAAGGSASVRAAGSAACDQGVGRRPRLGSAARDQGVRGRPRSGVAACGGRRPPVTTACRPSRRLVRAWTSHRPPQTRPRRNLAASRRLAAPRPAACSACTVRHSDLGVGAAGQDAGAVGDAVQGAVVEGQEGAWA